MKHISSIAFAAAVLAGSLAMAQPYSSTPALPAHTAIGSDARTELLMSMRKLWEDHITWTRVYVIDALAGLPDTDAAAGRLLRNQEDIGNAIKPYYGDAAGSKLTALLKIMIATEVVKAAKAGD